MVVELWQRQPPSHHPQWVEIDTKAWWVKRRAQRFPGFSASHAAFSYVPRYKQNKKTVGKQFHFQQPCPSKGSIKSVRWDGTGHTARYDEVQRGRVQRARSPDAEVSKARRRAADFPSALTAAGSPPSLPAYSRCFLVCCRHGVAHPSSIRPVISQAGC